MALRKSHLAILVVTVAAVIALAFVALSPTLVKSDVVPPPDDGLPAFMSITGANQGLILGSVDLEGHEGTIMVYAHDHIVDCEINERTGQVMARHQHHPLSIVKEIDKSSPKLYQALATGERLSDVTILWYRLTYLGSEEHYFTIYLEDARIVSIRSCTPSALDLGLTNYGPVEEVSFVYRKIRWTWELEGIEFEDSWIRLGK